MPLGRLAGWCPPLRRYFVERRPSLILDPKPALAGVINCSYTWIENGIRFGLRPCQYKIVTKICSRAQILKGDAAYSSPLETWVKEIKASLKGN